MKIFRSFSLVIKSFLIDLRRYRIRFPVLPMGYFSNGELFHGVYGPGVSVYCFPIFCPLLPICRLFDFMRFFTVLPFLYLWPFLSVLSYVVFGGGTCTLLTTGLGKPSNFSRDTVFGS